MTSWTHRLGDIPAPFLIRRRRWVGLFAVEGRGPSEPADTLESISTPPRLHHLPLLPSPPRSPGQPEDSSPERIRPRPCKGPPLSPSNSPSPPQPAAIWAPTLDSPPRRRSRHCCPRPPPWFSRGSPRTRPVPRRQPTVRRSSQVRKSRKKSLRSFPDTVFHRRF